MSDTTTRVFSCKPDKDAELKQDFTLTIDWTGCDEETTRAIAESAIVVKVQAQTRANWKDRPKDGMLTVSAIDFAPRGQRRSAIDVLKAMSPEERMLKLKELGLID